MLGLTEFIIYGGIGYGSFAFWAYYAKVGKSLPIWGIAIVILGCIAISVIAGQPDRIVMYENYSIMNHTTNGTLTPGDYRATLTGNLDTLTGSLIPQADNWNIVIPEQGFAYEIQQTKIYFPHAWSLIHYAMLMFMVLGCIVSSFTVLQNALTGKKW